MNKFLQNTIFSFIFLLTLTVGFNAKAQVDANLWSDNSSKIDEIFWSGQQQEFSDITGLSDFSPVIMVTNLISIGMGFIGIFTLVMIMLAGFKIMLSGGNEDNMNEAKRMLWGTVVGTFLMLGSFGIAKFFIGTVASATGLY